MNTCFPTEGTCLTCGHSLYKSLFQNSKPHCPNCNKCERGTEGFIIECHFVSSQDESTEKQKQCPPHDWYMVASGAAKCRNCPAEQCDCGPESRPSWDAYFLAIATQVASRATCDRKHVGYVAVKDKQILATGYNGSIPGEPHCDDAGHLIENNHCVRTVHAEENVVAQAAKHGISLVGATFYGTWGPPCWPCFKLVASTGVKRIVYSESTDERHQNSRVKETAARIGIELVFLP